MALQQWALPELSQLLPLDEEQLKEVVVYTETLSNVKAAEHLTNLLGDSPQAFDFITAFNERRSAQTAVMSSQARDVKVSTHGGDDEKNPVTDKNPSGKDVPAYAPPAYPPPSQSTSTVRYRPHTNQVIEAAHVRAKDEVCLTLTSVFKLSSHHQRADSVAARNAEYAAGCSIQISNLQQ